MSLDPIKRLLLARLADGRFHSGEVLARAAAVSRSAVWKRIKVLRDDFGLEIDSVKGKGYRVPSGLELFDSGLIRHYLDAQGDRRHQDLVVLESVDSTNTWLMARAAEGMDSGAVCLAEYQTAGRGRHGRSWVSPFGSNIYLSVLWRFALGPAQLSGLSIACGVAVANALKRIGVEGISLKWPNDVLWGRRKLAGLLLEVRGESSGPSHVVAGVGLNTRMPAHGAALVDQPWVDLASIPSIEAVSRNALAAALIGEVLEAMDTFSAAGLTSFLEPWARFDHFRDEAVVLSIGPRSIRGIYRGIASDGSMCIDVDGDLQSYNVGEVSLCRSGG